MVPGTARHADEPLTPPASEGSEAGACNPAPYEGALQRQPTSKPGRRRGEKSFHRLIQITVRAI